jgi:putative transcriptional regulator
MEIFRGRYMKNKMIEYRSKYNYSQETLSQKLGVSRQTVISIEKGKYNPSLSLAMIIAETFEAKVEDIFHLEPKDYK